MTANNYLIDALVRHHLMVQRYSNKTLKDISKYLKSAIRKAKNRLDKGLTSYGTKKYQKQLQLLQKELSEVYGEMNERALSDLIAFGVYSATFSHDLLGKAVKDSVTLHEIDAEAIGKKAVTAMMSLAVGESVQRYDIRGAFLQFSTKKAAEIVGEVQAGASLGETVKQIVARLDGLSALHERQAGSLVNTSTNSVGNNARRMSFIENDDILEGKRLIATLDSRTSPYCRSIDQKIIPLDAKGPPFHFNCRTVEVGVLKPEYAREIPGATRPSIGPDGVEMVPARTSYQDWLKRQPAAFQKEVLGEARYKLFSKGKLTLDKFVDDAGNSYTLEELKKREPLAFAEANI